METKSHLKTTLNTPEMCRQWEQAVTKVAPSGKGGSKKKGQGQHSLGFR